MQAAFVQRSFARTFYLFAAIFWAACAAAADPRIARVEQGLLPVAALQPDVRASIDERMRAYGVTGLSIAVIEDGRLAWAKGYGMADAASSRPVTSETLFQAASISKPVSAMGALLLVQRGRLVLDEPVNKALRGWKIPENTFTQRQPVTVRMLLNHTAGLEHLAGDSYSP